MPDVRSQTKTLRPAHDSLRLADDAIVEPRPDASMPSADEMFLSPRVLDAGAFARYAEMLKSLIGDAKQGARDLQDFAADADEMTAKCERSGDQLKSRLEASARIIKMVDERADRAARLLTTAREALPTEESVKARIEPAVQAAIEAAEARTAQVAAEAEQRMRSAAADVERRLAAMTARAAEQAERLETAGKAVDIRVDELETRLNELAAGAEQTTADHEARAKIATESARAELEPVLRRTAEATTAVDEVLSAAWRSADERAGKIADRIGPLQKACDTMLDRLGLEHDDADPGASMLQRLEDLVERSETTMQGADRVISQVDSLTAQADEVKTTFGMWLIEAATQLDVLEARREQLAGPLADAAEKIARVSPHLTTDLHQASVKLDQLQTEQAILREAVSTSITLAKQSGEKLNNQAAQMRALIDGSMHSLTQRVEEAGMWLGELINRAETVHGHPSTPIHAAPIETARVETPPIESAPTQPMPRHHEEARFETTPEQAITAIEAPQTPEPPAETETEAPSMSNMPNTQTRRPVEVEPIRTYDLPTPPQLPIDAVNFEGAEIVYGQSNDTDTQPHAAD